MFAPLSVTAVCSTLVKAIHLFVSSISHLRTHWSETLERKKNTFYILWFLFFCHFLALHSSHILPFKIPMSIDPKKEKAHKYSSVF